MKRLVKYLAQFAIVDAALYYAGVPAPWAIGSAAFFATVWAAADFTEWRTRP